MPKIAILGACLMGMVSVAYGQAGQTIYMPPKPEKRWTESQPLYAPYTGPGYGNPDTAAQREPIGHASKKYHDAAGASAYSKGGNTEATTLEKMRGRATWLGELCKARGYRYAHRLHIELYGNRRGT